MGSARLWQRASVVVMLLVFGSVSAKALQLSDYLKYSNAEKATYVTAAVSMLMFSVADGGDRERASCINDWYFRSRIVNGERVKPNGPTEMIYELARVGRADATFHAEEVILDMVRKRCPASGK